MDISDPDKIYRTLRRNYLVVYLSASFADWLQGPYLFRLYSGYGYSTDEISILYVAGFVGATISGLIIGHYADTFGRKKLCVVYSLVTTISCVATSTSDDYYVLTIGRLFGGASTSILFSTFESWYVGQHLSRYDLDEKLLADVLTRATLYNGFLAITAGLFSSLIADSLRYGPSAPFLLAVPFALLSACFCSKLWRDDLPVARDNSSVVSSLRKSLNLLFFSRNNRILVLLAVSQSIFETVLYIFVFLWSPVLEPMKFSQGMIFGCFMLCVIVGSTISSLSFFKREYLLCSSIGLGAFGIFGATLGLCLEEYSGNDYSGGGICLLSFFLFEISVGIYYPTIGYLRGIVIPETHRASVANLLRLPMNLFVCAGFAFIAVERPANFVVLASCSCALAIALLASLKLAGLFGKLAKRDVEKSRHSFLL